MMSPTQLKNCIAGLDSIRAIDPDMPLQHLLVLLLVARDEAQEDGLTMTQLAERAGLTLSSASRAVRQLSKTNRQQAAGLDLVVDQVNWLNRREKHLKLTHRGRTVVNQYLAAVHKE